MNKDNQFLGADPAQPGAERHITHVIIPNDDPIVRTIKCAYCPSPATGAVQVEDPKKPGKQNYIRACTKHKTKAMADAARNLRKYHKKRVKIDVKGLDDEQK